MTLLRFWKNSIRSKPECPKGGPAFAFRVLRGWGPIPDLRYSAVVRALPRRGLCFGAGCVFWGPYTEPRSTRDPRRMRGDG
jgi:hypothetical protein